MNERSRVKAWIVTSAVVLGLLALVAAPAVMAKSITGNVISNSGKRLVIRTGAGNVTFEVPEKFNRTLRPGWTVTVQYKSEKKFGTYNSGKNKGKKYLVATVNTVTKKTVAKNSGTGQPLNLREGSEGGDGSGGGGGSENVAGGSGGSGTTPGG